MTSSPKPSDAAGRIVLSYAVLSALWIVGSDLAVLVTSHGPVRGAVMSIVKGLAFVAVTSGFLYLLISRRIDSLAKAYLSEITSSHHQIAEAAEHARRLQHANRLYAVLSAVNRAVTRKPAQQELIQDICRILVETGGLRLAWFGAAEDDGWVIPQVSFGDSRGYLRDIRISVHDIPEGHGPAGSCIRERQPFISNDIAANVHMQPWRARALQSGIAAAAGFPVALPDGRTACLIVYSEERDFFSAAEEALLAEISADLSYALEFSATGAELEWNRQALSKTQDLARIGGWSIDLLTGMSSNSPEASRINGMPVGIVPKERFLDIVATEDVPRLQHALEGALETGNFYDIEHRISVAGEMRWVQNRAEIEYDPSGRPVRVNGMIQDISERKQAEEAIREQEHLLRSIIDMIPAGISRIDSDLRYRLANRKYEEWFGVPPEALRGRQVQEVIGERDWEIARPQIERVLAGERITFEHPTTTLEGDDRWLHVNLVPFLDPDGTPSGYVAHVTDITALRETAEELRQARDLAESASRAKSTFLSTMSHELRTPLNGVLGMAQLLELTALTAEQRQYLADLKVCGKNLLLLIDDILDLSKIEAGRLDLDMSGFSLRRCLDEIVLLHRQSAVQKGLFLDLSVAGDVPDRVVGDQLRVRQVLINLLGNAIKFTLHGGVALAAAVLEQHDSSLLLQITVTDTGIGISPENWEKIFSPFVQADGSTTRRFGGTGLGLSISRHLTELMGGRLSLTGSSAAGSCFTVTLPFTRA